MASKSTEAASRVTTALTGMSLAVSIAREAADAVPVVKQSLGAAVRIVALAEKIDSDREALHALAEKSLQLAQRVKDVMDGRTPNARISNSFEKIIKAFDRIERFMMKHVAHNRVHRAISYAFTVPQHVGRLSRELGDAVQELVLVALLDLNNEAHAAHQHVSENARYVGNFRLLKDCDVDKLGPVLGECTDSDIGARYYKARVDGQLLVVRYFGGIESQNACDGEQARYDEIMERDVLFQTMSTVRKSHPNVTCIYGWSRGSIHNRFTVFKSGLYRMDILDTLPSRSTTLVLCDAVHYLQMMGIMVINPETFLLDDHLEPIIGLHNELRPYNLTGSQLDAECYWYSVVRILDSPPRTRVAAKVLQEAVAGYHSKRLCELLGTSSKILRLRYVLPKAGFSKGCSLSDDTTEHLLRLLDMGQSIARPRGPALTWRRTWVAVLLALGKKRRHRSMKGLQVLYTAYYAGWQPDDILIYGVSEDTERIVYDTYTVTLPADQWDAARETFGIPVMFSDENVTHHLVATGAPGTYCAL